MGIVSNIKSLYGALVSLKDEGAWTRVLGGTFGGTSIDLAKEAGDLHANGTVAICQRWLYFNFIETPIYVCKRPDKPGGNPVPIPRHPGNVLLQTHGEGADYAANVAGLIQDLFGAGNALWWIRESAAGTPAKIEWIPWRRVTLRFVHDPTTRISQYVIATNAGSEMLDPTEVIHFKSGVDPNRPYLGWPILGSILPEIVVDRRASLYEAGLLINSGNPSYLLTPKQAGQAGIEGIQAALANRDPSKAGKWTFLSTPIDATKTAMSPDELGVKTIRDSPESRTAAAHGLAAMTVGLAVGAKLRTYSNQKDAEKHSQLNGFIPLLKLVARYLNAALLPLIGNPETETIAFDLSNIASLNEVHEELHAQVRQDFEKNLMTLNEARLKISLPADPVHGAKYYFELGGAASAALTGGLDGGILAAPKAPPGEPPDPTADDTEEDDAESDDDETDTSQGTEGVSPGKRFRLASGYY